MRLVRHRVAPKYRTTLKREFGLTDNLIRDLGPPDLERPNPHLKKGPPAALYLLTRVRKFCRNRRRAIQKAAEKRPGRRQAAAKGRETYLAALSEWPKALAEGLRFLKPLPSTLDELIKVAQTRFDRKYGKAFPVSTCGVCAYVRHQHTDYDAKLVAMRERAMSAQVAFKWQLKEDFHESVRAIVDVKVATELSTRHGEAWTVFVTECEARPPRELDSSGDWFDDVDDEDAW